MNSMLLSSKSHQRGASIIEVLVAALILSIGMLALVGVQATSTQLGTLNQFRATASRLGQDYADRMRANQGLDANGVVDQSNLASYAIAGQYDGNASSIQVPANCANTCSRAQFIENITQIDMAQMRNQARLALPNGDLRVQIQNLAGVGNVVDIWVLWRHASTVSESADVNTVGGIGCPTNFVSAGTFTQCQLTRIVL